MLVSTAVCLLAETFVTLVLGCCALATLAMAGCLTWLVMESHNSVSAGRKVSVLVTCRAMQ